MRPYAARILVASFMSFIVDSSRGRAALRGEVVPVVAAKVAQRDALAAWERAAAGALADDRRQAQSLAQQLGARVDGSERLQGSAPRSASARAASHCTASASPGGSANGRQRRPGRAGGAGAGSAAR